MKNGTENAPPPPVSCLSRVSAMTTNADTIRGGPTRRYWIVLLGVFLAVVAGQGAYILYLHATSPDKPAPSASQPVQSAQSPERSATPMVGPFAPFPDPWGDPGPRNMFAELSQMQAEIDRLFEDTFARMSSCSGVPAFSGGLQFNLSDDGDHYVVTVPAGEALSDVRIEVKDGSLVLSAKHETGGDVQSPGGVLLSRASSMGTFQQSIRFPEPVDPGSLRTEYADGSIRVEVAKRQ